MFIYPIYNHNRRNIITIYIYIFIYKTRLASNEIFSPSNKIHREVGRAKDLSAPLYIYIYTKGVLISPWSDQEGNRLQRQKVLIFIYHIYNHIILVPFIYIYKTRLASNEIFSPSNKMNREVVYIRGADKSLARPGRKQATATEDFDVYISYLRV